MLTAPEPKQWATRHGIRVMQPEKITPEIIAELKQERWDLFIVIAYGKILPEALISIPRYGTINVHYSLLPAYRGATPVESAILHGDTTTGVCIQQMRYALDSGPLLAEKEIPIDPTDTTVSLRSKLNEEAQQLLPGVLADIFEGRATPKEQDETKATLCKKRKKEDGEISLDDAAEELDRKWRAYQPWPGLYFFEEKNGKKIRIKIKAAHLEQGVFVIDTVIPENGKPLSKEEFIVWRAS